MNGDHSWNTRLSKPNLEYLITQAKSETPDYQSQIWISDYPSQINLPLYGWTGNEYNTSWKDKTCSAFWTAIIAQPSDEELLTLGPPSQGVSIEEINKCKTFTFLSWNATWRDILVYTHTQFNSFVPYFILKNYFRIMALFSRSKRFHWCRKRNYILKAERNHT